MGRLTAQEGIERSTLIGGSLTDRKRFDFSSSLPVKEKGIQIEDGYVDEEADAEGREELQKLWNLRPRKAPAAKNGHRIGASSKTIDAHVSNGGMADAAHGGVEKKKERAKLWISLSKEEIEEDIFILTGSRPARRPKRRPKTVQKQLDIVFPGLSLLGVTAESFKIPHSPPKLEGVNGGGPGGQFVQRGPEFENGITFGHVCPDVAHCNEWIVLGMEDGDLVCCYLAKH